MKYERYGSLAVIIASLLWSFDAVLRRHLYVLPAPVIVFWEHAIGFIVLLPYILTSLGAFKKLTRKQWGAITLVAFLSGAVGTILYTAALGRIQYIPFSIVVLLQQLNPIFAIAASAILLKEKLSRRFLGLSAIALVAAYFVTFPDIKVNLSTGQGTVIAALFAVGAAAAWGTSTALSKYSLKNTSSIHITALRFGITPIFALMFVGLSGSSQSLTNVGLEQFKYLALITFSTGLVALVVYYFGLQRVLASRAAILELAWPASAVLVGWIWLDQKLTLSQIIAAAVLTFTVVQIARDVSDGKDNPSSKKTAAKIKPSNKKSPSV